MAAGAPLSAAMRNQWMACAPGLLLGSGSLVIAGVVIERGRLGIEHQAQADHGLGVPGIGAGQQGGGIGIGRLGGRLRSQPTRRRPAPCQVAGQFCDGARGLSRRMG